MGDELGWVEREGEKECECWSVHLPEQLRLGVSANLGEPELLDLDEEGRVVHVVLGRVDEGEVQRRDRALRVRRPPRLRRRLFGGERDWGWEFTLLVSENTYIFRACGVMLAGSHVKAS